MTSVNLITVQSKDFDRDRFISLCGTDGMNTDAAYDSHANSMTICPGYLLLVLQNKSLDILYATLGHELGHSIDPYTYEVINKKHVYPIQNLYLPFLACVVTYHSDKFTPGKSANWFLDQQSRATNCQKRLSVSHSSVQSIEHAKEWEKFVYSNYVNLHLVANDSEKIILSHAREISADIFGTVADAARFKTDISQNENRAITILREYCAISKDTSSDHVAKLKEFQNVCAREWSGAAELDDPDDNVHPTARYRFDMTVNSPVFQKALRCQTSDFEKKFQYCEFGQISGTESAAEELKNAMEDETRLYNKTFGK